MTEREVPNSTAAHPDPVAELRHIVDGVAQAEKLLVTATSQLEAVAAQPVGPPHPPPPPPWSALLAVVQRELDGCAATVARAQRVAAALTRGAHGGGPGA